MITDADEAAALRWQANLQSRALLDEVERSAAFADAEANLDIVTRAAPSAAPALDPQEALRVRTWLQQDGRLTDAERQRQHLQPSGVMTSEEVDRRIKRAVSQTIKCVADGMARNVGKLVKRQRNSTEEAINGVVAEFQKLMADENKFVRGELEALRRDLIDQREHEVRELLSSHVQAQRNH